MKNAGHVDSSDLSFISVDDHCSLDKQRHC
nr:MAG TPA: hypothetical protein [Caudoviricetes sp.]